MPASTRNNKAPADRRRQSKVRDSEVLEVAIKVFHEHGYAASSVQMIADELGILKGSLYYYMSGKEELLYRLLADVHQELGHILNRARALESVGPLERLQQYVIEQVEYAVRNVPLIAIYYRDVDQLAEPHRQDIYAQRRQHEIFVRDLLTDAQGLGLVSAEEDPKVLANLVFGSFIWTYRWYNTGGSLAASSLAEACGRFVVRAVSEHGAPALEA